MATPLEHDQRALLGAFAERVRTSPHNLVSRRAREELWERHISEALHLAARLPTPARVLDVGSGGGLPGMVIAIVRPELEVVLLDSSEKKTAFLEEVAAELGITVGVVRGRAEDLRDGGLRGRFDVVTARAVAPLERLLGWTLPFLTPGGLLYAVKGERWEQEVLDATTALRTWGGHVVATPSDDPDMRPRVVVVRHGTTREAR